MKYAAIADWADRDEYPVDFMCKQLAVSPSGFYAWRGRVPSPRDQDNDRLLAIIVEAYRRLRGNPGVRRIHAELRALGERVGKNRVARLMQAAGLRGRHPRAWKRTTTSGPDPAPAPDLIGRDFTAERPNQKWCSDITYIKTWNGWAYLAIVIDLHSRAVVGWALADHMRTDLVIEALTLAIARRRPPAGSSFTATAGPNSHRPNSPRTARTTTSAVPWAAPGIVSTTPSPSPSSRPTKRNSSTPAPG